MSKEKDNKIAQEMVDKFDIRVTSLRQACRQLSGGNSKVVIGKWLVNPVLIMDEATAGIDVGAKREIYQIMVELAKRVLELSLSLQICWN